MKLEMAPRAVTERSAIRVLLEPHSVAVVGASPDTAKPGGRFLAFLHKYGFGGEVFAVNPKYAGTLDGYYASLSDLPRPVDLAALLIPAPLAADYLRHAAQAGVRAVMVLASGFAEAGGEGEARQEALAEVARETGVALLGPNCLGLTNMDCGLVASFSNAFEGERTFGRGAISFVSQSGAMGAALFVQAQSEGIGVSRFISTGNEAALEFTDFVESLTDDPKVTTILGYIEALRDGRRFVEAASAVRARGKTLAVMKVGKSDAGASAAQSHTGAIVSSSAVYEAAFRRAGVLEARNVQELLDLAVALPPKIPARGNRVGIVSSSGGAAVIMADACALNGLIVPRFADSTIDRLGAMSSQLGGLENPIDYGPAYADPDAIEACVQAAADDPGIDVVLYFIALSPALQSMIEPRLARVQSRSGKPVIAVWMTGPDGAVRGLRDQDVTAYADIERAVRVATHLVEHGRFAPPGDSAPINLERRKATQATLARAAHEGRATLNERETKDLLASYGLPVTRDVVVTSAEEAEAAVRALDGPAVLKAEADDLLHKSDADAVRLGVTVESAGRDFAAVVEGASSHLGRSIGTAVVQPLITPGLEMLIGLKSDSQFGPTISVGLGGVMTEILADVATELVPVDRATAASMLDRLAGARLLDAFRGRPALDRSALTDAIVALSTFALDAGASIEELDLNPVILHPAGEGCVVVDGAAVLSARAAKQNHDSIHSTSPTPPP